MDVTALPTTTCCFRCNWKLRLFPAFMIVLLLIICGVEILSFYTTGTAVSKWLQQIRVSSSSSSSLSSSSLSRRNSRSNNNIIINNNNTVSREELDALLKQQQDQIVETIMTSLITEGMVTHENLQAHLEQQRKHMKAFVKAAMNELPIHTIQKDQRSLPKKITTTRKDRRPLLAETLYHYGTFPLDKLLRDGPAMPYYYDNNLPTTAAGSGSGSGSGAGSSLIWPAQNESEAVCTLRSATKAEQTLSGQFPHNLQQLLRCFSWWQMNQHQQPVLHLQGSSSKSSNSYGGSTTNHQTKFINDFYNGLHQVFNVRLDYDDDDVDRQKKSPHVTVPIEWIGMHRILDAYAMNSQDAQTLTDGFLNHFSPDNTRRAGCPPPKKSSFVNTNNSMIMDQSILVKQQQQQKKTKPIIGFLNREGSRRAIGNHKEILSALEAVGGYTSDQIRYQPNFDGMSMKDQIIFASEVDILMGPHGAQFTNTLFQPICGSLFEFFNEDYLVPNFFGSLAALSGKHHFILYNGDTNNNTLSQARAIPSFQVDPMAVVQVTNRLVEKWESCCSSGFRQ